MNRAIEKEFHEEMLTIYRNVGRRTGYWAYRFLKLVKRRGGLAAAKYFLNKTTVSEGFERLKDVGLLKFSVEALVLQKPWSQLFTQAEKDIARKRLKRLRAAAVLSDKRDKRRLQHVVPILCQALKESDAAGRINWKKRLLAKETYKTDGWKVVLGNLGRGTPRLELWLDRYPVAKHRCFWFGFFSNNKRVIKTLITGAPSHLSKPGKLTNTDYKLEGGLYALKNRFKAKDFDQPFYEEYFGKYLYFGQFDATDSTSQSAARAVAKRAATLFADVLRDTTPVANDASSEELPGRVKQSVNRIIRDTEISRQIKRLYGFRCQVCGHRLEIGPDDFYAEAHHLQPLGGEHKGPDVPSNLMCLCPNHHALFDYFAFPIKPAHLKLKKHKLGRAFVNYHNMHVNKGGAS